MVELIKYGSYVYEWFYVEQSLHLIMLSSIGAILLWFLFRHQQSKAKEIPWSEQERLIQAFQPDPLVPDFVKHKYQKRLVESKAGKRVIVDGVDCLNVATHNYLGFMDDEDLAEAAAATISEYGVGSCGPRGFYGTADVHINLEERLAEFMGVEEACVYAYGFSTAASAIPAYCKRRDVIFADEAVNFAIQKGFDASRSTVHYFRHNDMQHLEELLVKHCIEADKGSSAKVRRFLVAEGIYASTGAMCPLPELVKLRAKYKLRMFLDESISFGTVGATGRGVMEYFNVPKEEVDLRMGSMEGALCSVGGFCCGSSFIVEHQRLSGLGYCFSASLPPLLAVAALTSLAKLKEDPSRAAKLQKVSNDLHAALSDLPGVELKGHELSPVKHLVLRDSRGYFDDLERLHEVSNECFNRQLAIVSPTLLPHAEKFPTRASLRVVANVLLDDKDIEFIKFTLDKCLNSVLVK